MVDIYYLKHSIMRPRDKNENMLKANMLLEQRYNEEKGIVSEAASENLELKSLAKKLYLGFKNMGAKVMLVPELKAKEIGHKRGELPDEDVHIWVQDSGGDKIFMNFYGDKAISFIPKVKEAFPNFEFDEPWGAGVRFADNSKVQQLLIKPGKTTS